MALNEIIEVCKRLHQRHLLAAADGNVSVRDDDGQIWITPSGRAKRWITVDDLVAMDSDGHAKQGRPSSESAMHLEIYRRCPRAKAVVHAHPPHAIAYSLAHPTAEELPTSWMPEVILATGGIPIVPYARPSTNEMADVLHPHLPQHRVMVLARHGGLTWGESLEEAYLAMERLEHAALIMHLALTQGEPEPLPRDEVMRLYQMRRNLGDRVL